MCGAIMLAIAGAGVFKLSDLFEFHRTLSSWILIPDSLKQAVVVVLPVLEVFLAGLWLLRIERRRSYWIVLSMLLAFNTAVCVQLMLGKAPECGCFGLVDHWLKEHAGNWVTLTRSAAMAGVLLLSLAVSVEACTKLSHRKGVA